MSHRVASTLDSAAVDDATRSERNTLKQSLRIGPIFASPTGPTV